MLHILSYSYVALDMSSKIFGLGVDPYATIIGTLGYNHMQTSFSITENFEQDFPTLIIIMEPSIKISYFSEWIILCVM